MSLRGFQSFDESGLTEVLTDNLSSYLDFGFLQKNGIVNVDRSNSQYNNQHKLYRINNNVWASRRKNWVWEDGYGTPISGIWVNNTLLTSGYQINYRDGCVIFDNSIGINSNVELNYSYKYIHVFDADENRLFQGDKYSFQVSENTFINGSGFSLPDRRVQLPAIGIEVLTGRTSQPYELGNYSQSMNTRVLCNILSTDDRIAKRIADYISYQKEKVFVVFDRDQAAASGFYPHNYDGTINNPSGTYNYLSTNFPYSKVFAKKASFKDVTVENVNKINSNLFHITARIDLDVIF